MKLFFSMLFQTTPKMPSFYPTFTCPIAHTMKLTTKVFIFLSFQSRKKKLKSGCHLTKQNKNFIHENCFRQIFIACEPSCLHKFQNENKNFSTFKNNILALQKLALKKIEWLKHWINFLRTSVFHHVKQNCVFHRICIKNNLVIFVAQNNSIFSEKTRIFANF